MTLPRFDRSWTLFLDRDGVLNRKIEDGYVLEPSMLEILPGVSEALDALAQRFGIIVVVTNQRGVGRGLMTVAELDAVHERLLQQIRGGGGRIDAIFVCPHDTAHECQCRKPRIGLAVKAKVRFPEIEFSRSVLVGDSPSDMEMGNQLGMCTVGIGSGLDTGTAHTRFPSLLHFSRGIG